MRDLLRRWLCARRGGHQWSFPRFEHEAIEYRCRRCPAVRWRFTPRVVVVR